MKLIKAASVFLFPFIIQTSFSQNIIANFELADANGNTLSLDDLRGEKFTLIEFWTTWCLPCHELMKNLVKMYPEIKNAGGEIIGINADGPRNIAKIKPFLHSMEVPYPVLLDTQMELMLETGATVFPTLFIINPKNEIVFMREGFTNNGIESLRAEIKKLAKE